MKINNIIITFWFNKIIDIKNKSTLFEAELKDFFNGINSIGVPADINPEYPRLTAISDGGHTNLNISMINVQLNTKFDNNYCSNYQMCFEYIKQRSEKIFEILSNKLNANIVYSAIMAICEIDDENPINVIKSHLLSEKLNEDYCETGVKIAQIIDKKYYENITINSAQQITITQKMESGQNEIIMPLISLANSKIEKRSLIINYEINDKYSFDKNSEYHLEKDNFMDMLSIAENNINSKINEIINN